MTTAVAVRPARTAPLRRTVGAAVAAALLLAVAPAVAAGGTPATRRESFVVAALPGRAVTVAAAVEALGGRVAAALPVVDGFAADLPAAAAAALRAVPGVVAVTPNRPVHLSGRYGEGSGVASAVHADAVRAPEVWGTGNDGRGVGVAIVDTGVNDEGDLAGKVVHEEDFTAEQDGADRYGHGTFVAGLVAGSGAASGGAVAGVAPGAHLVSVKIAGRDGSTDLVKLLAALQWVVTFRHQYGIRVLNLSLGTPATQDYRVDPINLAVQRVWNSGIVVVVAAGNDGNAPGTIAKPGDDPLVVTAGSTDDHTTAATADDTLAPFSASGPTASNGLAKPDLLAPGKSVVSLRVPGSTIDEAVPTARVGDHYFKGSGTSFSSAVTAGAAALVLAGTPSLTPDQVKHRLLATAGDLAGAPTDAVGAGLLDAWAATTSASTASANEGVAPARGGGSLQASRAGGCLRDTAGGCLPDAEADAAVGFDAAEYFGSSWAGSRWAGSSWAGSSWAGSRWAGSSWAGSSWAGSRWAGSSWAGSSWAGSSWAGSRWAGSSWAGSSWAGSRWAGSSWAGSSWAAGSWS